MNHKPYNSPIPRRLTPICAYCGRPAESIYAVKFLGDWFCSAGDRERFRSAARELDRAGYPAKGTIQDI